MRKFLSHFIDRLIHEATPFQLRMIVLGFLLISWTLIIIGVLP